MDCQEYKLTNQLTLEVYPDGEVLLLLNPLRGHSHMECLPFPKVKELVAILTPTLTTARASRKVKEDIPTPDLTPVTKAWNFPSFELGSKAKKDTPTKLNTTPPKPKGCGTKVLPHNKSTKSLVTLITSIITKPPKPTKPLKTIQPISPTLKTSVTIKQPKQQEKQPKQNVTPKIKLSAHRDKTPQGWGVSVKYANGSSIERFYSTRTHARSASPADRVGRNGRIA